jgi:hypothetical protein
MFSIDNKVVQVLRDCGDQEDDGGAKGLITPSTLPCERRRGNPVVGESKSAVATRRSFCVLLAGLLRAHSLGRNQNCCATFLQHKFKNPLKYNKLHTIAAQ